MREGAFQGKCISKGTKVQKDGVCLNGNKHDGISIVSAYSRGLSHPLGPPLISFADTVDSVV